MTYKIHANWQISSVGTKCPQELMIWELKIHDLISFFFYIDERDDCYFLVILSHFLGNKVHKSLFDFLIDFQFCF